MTKFWQTSISRVRPDEITVRGYAIEELARSKSFGDVTYLLLTGELPAANEGRMIEAILVACCEHSLASPSVDAVRFVASSGVPLQTAVAAGVLAVGDVHGGAIEPCAELMRRAIAERRSAVEVVTSYKNHKQRIPGFGHPVHKRDPRSSVLVGLARELGIAGLYLEFALALESAMETVFGRRLPINVDGVVAALICDMKIDPQLGKAFFIIGRAPGYVAHAYEQITKERPFKAASFEEIEYTGPQSRALPT